MIGVALSRARKTSMKKALQLCNEAYEKGMDKLRCCADTVFC